MRSRYIRASEVESFAFCRRSWFLERQNQPSLSGDPDAGADRPGRGHSTRISLSAARLSLLLLILGVAGIACMVLMVWMQP